LSEDSEIVDIHHAGTAMRFLTSYYSIQEGKTTILTGSKRMKERPIKNLVTALQNLGAKSNIWKMKDFRLLKFTEEKLRRPKWMFRPIFPASLLPLLLIAGKLENGLEINLVGEVTSRSYIEMTLNILTRFGIKSSFIGNTIKVEKFSQSSIINYEVESDWSSASYFYSLCIGKKNHSFEKLLQRIYTGRFGHCKNL
jgi:3-phosphoshikimate 1-carboxyvinyltransferase